MNLVFVDQEKNINTVVVDYNYLKYIQVANSKIVTVIKIIYLFFLLIFINIFSKKFADEISLSLFLLLE